MKVYILDEVSSLIEKFDPSARVKVFRAVELLIEFGNHLGMPHSRKISSEIFELRTRGKQEIRMLYVYYRSDVFILHVFIKKTQKTPRREIDLAKSRLGILDYK